MGSCSVCTEVFTVALRKYIPCKFCDFRACAQCHERYLLNTPENPHCMSCRNGWNRSMMAENFTNVFVNKRYKEHRENVLLERERSLMPETQPYVETEIKCKKLVQQREALAKRRHELYTLQIRMLNSDLSEMGQDDNWVEARIERQRRASLFTKEIAAIAADTNLIEYSIEQYRNPGAAISKSRVATFVRACPVNGCKGFLSTAWKCGVCEAHVCAQCHDVKDSEDLQAHTCDPANVATADLLRRDSKPCPKCACMNFKISGCDQMYCTQCHTPFSWRTGQVVSGNIHNPHYYEFLRRTQGNVPRAPGDVVCGGLPEIYSFLRYSGVATTQTQSKFVHDVHRNINHLRYLIEGRYTPTEYTGNRDLRIKYMMGDLTDEDFKKKIQQREKSNNKKQDIREVLVTYTTVTTDIFQKYTTDKTTCRDDFYTELQTLREYTRGLLDNLATTWKCAVPKFGYSEISQHMLGENMY